MTGSPPASLEGTGATGAAPRVISAPLSNKPAAGDSLDFEVIGGVPFCFYRFTDRSYMQHLQGLCLAAEADILKLPVADNWDREQSDQEMRQFGTTSRFPFYNMLLLRDVSVIHIFRAIQRCYMTAADKAGLDKAPVWVQCWENVLRRDGHLHKHAHNFFMHGHLTVATPGSRTGYEFENGEVVEIENEIGLLTLIGQAGVMHYTTPNPSDEPRISLAFDLCRAPHMTNDTMNRHTFIPLL
jgi:hypothetical protein